MLATVTQLCGLDLSDRGRETTDLQNSIFLMWEVLVLEGILEMSEALLDHVMTERVLLAFSGHRPRS